MSFNPVYRSLHDAGLATWTGGSLMGAIGLNGAASKLANPRERAAMSTNGWSRWAPANAAALAAHLAGSVGMLVTDWPRVRSDRTFARESAIKAATTGLGVGLSGWSLLLNRKMAKSVPVPVEGATEPAADTPDDVASTQRQLRVIQWLHPLVGLSLVAVSAVLSEEQRSNPSHGMLPMAAKKIGTSKWGAVAAAGAGASLLASLALRGRGAGSGDSVIVVEEAVEVDTMDRADGQAQVPFGVR